MLHTIRKVLIANRGEIAVRIIQTCRKMGLATVAVYSEADVGAPHTILADESFLIGGPRAEDSYLNIESIIHAAQSCSADCIHPGYGFLSESSEFASKVIAAGIIFIGPKPETMAQLGDKDKARTLAKQLGLNVPPGYENTSSSAAELIQAANDLGYPLLIKAAAGGGGRGMRLVENKSQLVTALESAGREAKSFFGNEKLILEKLLRPARHIEVQLIADNHGNVCHLFERDCSLQRKYQKVIEEAPARNLDESIRKSICQAAVTIAKAVNFSGAATVEFLIPIEGCSATEKFYFLEVNPRLQVEHPVTEMVTGLDLVELQLKVAIGEPLPFTQAAIKINGSAIEARLYAEEPAHGFRPSSGKITHLELPQITNPHQLRLDHALSLGLNISTFYDSMLVKFIAWGNDHLEASTILNDSIKNTLIIGVETNSRFLQNLLSLAYKPNAKVETTFIEKNITRLSTIHVPNKLPEVALCYFLLTRWRTRKILNGNQQKSPFRKNFYWRGIKASSSTSIVCEPAKAYSIFISDDSQLTLTASIKSSTLQNKRFLFQIDIENKSYDVSIPSATISTDLANNLIFEVHGVSYRVISPFKFPNAILIDGVLLHVKPEDADDQVTSNSTSISNTILSPLPGTVMNLGVKPGDLVEKGRTLLAIESMKMEHSIFAPAKCQVIEVRVSNGGTVKKGDVLLTMLIEE